MAVRSDLRNVAIIAHVDHGKTTLVDQLLKASGTFRDNQEVQERAMDSMDLEREKGITIKAKNTAVLWQDHVINIVDTPGHADFGSEVERIMRMVDGVLLVVDALDGPQAQTRFVLRKALEEGVQPMVLVNKMDRPNADPARVHDLVLDLLLDLNASPEQFEAPFLYGSARDGFLMRDIDGEKQPMTLLLQTIIDHVSPPKVEAEGEFQMLVSNIDWDDYVGRVAIGRVQRGSVHTGDRIWVAHPDGTRTACKVTKVFRYAGLLVTDSAEGVAGDIIGVAGFEEVDIGETLCGGPSTEALPFMAIDPPTIEMEISVNDGPLAGREGDHVTSRKIRDRLMREQKMNVGIKVSESDLAGVFKVSARGSMQIAVLVEQMRREGFEVLVSRPSVILRRDADGLKEPFETLYVEVPDEYVGGVMRRLAVRRGQVESMEPSGSRTVLVATIPTRGLIGFEFELMTLTSGHGVHSHLFKEYGPYGGPMQTRQSGTLVSMETGQTTAYALAALEDRGRLYVGPAEEVYQGMIVGENARAEDLPVNPTKAKHITNHRSTGDGKGIQLSPVSKLSLERAIEYIEADELVETTPKNIRLRKRVLCSHERARAKKRELAAPAATAG